MHAYQLPQHRRMAKNVLCKVLCWFLTFSQHRLFNNQRGGCWLFFFHLRVCGTRNWCTQTDAERAQPASRSHESGCNCNYNNNQPPAPQQPENDHRNDKVNDKNKHTHAQSSRCRRRRRLPEKQSGARASTRTCYILHSSSSIGDAMFSRESASRHGT